MKHLPLSLLALSAVSAAAWAAETAPDVQTREIAREAPIALLVDVDTGQTLYAANADRRFIPASITKVMTAYIAFQMLESGTLSPEQELVFSETLAEDWERTGSTMFLTPGEAVTVDNLLRGITSVSANDGSVTLAEGALGSAEAWVERMNETAQALGMHDTHFGTPNGWPDDGNTFTTAHDLEILTKALIDEHPERYARYFGQPGLRHNGVAQANHDPISGVIEGADGLKTGYTNQAGHGFLGSAERDGTRLIMVLGAVDRYGQRVQIARELIEWGFTGYDRRTVFAEGNAIGQARVQNGTSDRVMLIAPKAINVAIPKGSSAGLELNLAYNGPISAPIAAGDNIAELELRVEGMAPARVPLIAAKDVPKADFTKRISNAFAHWFGA